MKNETQKEIDRRINDLLSRLNFNAENQSHAVPKEQREIYKTAFKAGCEWALRNVT